MTTEKKVGFFSKENGVDPDDFGAVIVLAIVTSLFLFVGYLSLQEGRSQGFSLFMFILAISSAIAILIILISDEINSRAYAKIKEKDMIEYHGDSTVIEIETLNNRIFYKMK